MRTESIVAAPKGIRNHWARGRFGLSGWLCQRAGVAFACLLLLFTWGCKAPYYQRAADREVYRIIQEKEAQVFGKTNAFTVNTRHSQRDPYEIKAQEIIQERMAPDRKILTVTEAIQLAIKNSRQYQLRKENLYLSALSLTGQRYEFSPQFFAGATSTIERETDGDRLARLHTQGSQVGMDKLFRTGGRLGVTLANDILRYFTGDPRREATSIIAVNLVQPLLRGAGASVVAENLTQAERNVIYELRSFTQFQRSFAVDIVSTYYRIVRSKDTVRNNYDNYQRLITASERAEALAKDRLQALQADQARQSELRAKRSYLASVKSYEDTLDGFKITLGIPLTVKINLDDGALEEIRSVGLIPLNLDEDTGYRLAVEHELDLLNDIDKLEDSQRKLKVAANQLKTDLNFVASSSLESNGPTDYRHFDPDKIRASVGLQLNLPVDRLLQRNAYRSRLVDFERAIRTLSLALDNARQDVNQGLRQLRETQREYEIQQTELTLAQRRVDRETLLVQAGRTEIRNQLEAQDALIQAKNGITQTLIDYHLARLQLLLNIGALNTNVEKFWLNERPILEHIKLPAAPAGPKKESDTMTVITPDQLFKTE